MSDPMAAPKAASKRGRERGKPPYHLAPWVAMAAMAAATLWPRARRKAEGPVPPRAPTPAELDRAEPGRGRCAGWPLGIPPLGWKDILWRTYREIGRDRLPALAGGITFYLLLATFPAIAAFVSLYGIFSDVETVERQLIHLSAILPSDAVTLIGSQMLRIAASRHATLGAAFIASTLLSVWSANAGMKALFDGLNITYDESEKRDYLRRSLITYAATFAGLVFIGLVVSVLIAAPVFFHQLGVHRVRIWWAPTRWAIVFLMAAITFTLLYRYGPSRRHAKWQWVVFGGVGAAAVWLAVSLGFSWYVNNFSHFGVTYGSLGAMIAYMLWVWMTAMVILTGAELNSEIEHQTAIDTTIGTTKPIGERGATMADTVGKAFTTSPREAADWATAFCLRQVGYVVGFVKRITRPTGLLR
ncbi:MAG TPA: YihY/virulence factor BrkB family protein [Caulobacteraceae bacterium]|nr:YihY/virulence factor BrkB family protein [Caulobacteraceae bacterium]